MSEDRQFRINMMAEQNVFKAIKDGPRIRTDYNVWVVARDRKRGLVLLGGLGPMGCGQMWFIDQEKYHDNETYADAPEAPDGARYGIDQHERT